MTLKTQVLLSLALFASLGEGRADAQVVQAEPSIQIQDMSDRLRISIDGVSASSAQLRNRGDRLIVPIEAGGLEKTLRVDDRTVKSIEVSHGRHPRLSVKLRHGRTKTKAIGNAATMELSESGVVITVPRWPIPNNMLVAPTVPETITPTPVASAEAPTAEAAVAPVEAPTDTHVAAAATTAGSAEPAAAPEPSVEAPAAVARTEAEPAPSLGLRDEGSQGGSNMTIVFGLLVILGGVGVLTWRSRKKKIDETGGIDMQVVSTKQLGAKSKVVWLNVGERDLLVAVGESGPRLLSQWRRPKEQSLLGDSHPDLGALAMGTQERELSQNLDEIDREIGAEMQLYAGQLEAEADRIAALSPALPEQVTLSTAEQLIQTAWRMPALTMAALLLDLCGWTAVGFRLALYQSLKAKLRDEKDRRVPNYVTLDDFSRVEEFARRVTEARQRIDGEADAPKRGRPRLTKPAATLPKPATSARKPRRPKADEGGQSDE